MICCQKFLGAEALSGSKFDGVRRVVNVIYRNCPFYDPDIDENFARFMEILSEDGLTAEETYDRLMGETEEGLPKGTKI